MRREDLFECAELERGDAFILDGLGGAQSFGLCAHGCVEFEAGNGLDIEVDEVPIEDGKRQVGAGVVRRAVMDGVQGIQGDEVDAQIGHGPVDEGPEVAEVSAAPVASGTEAPKGHSETGLSFAREFFCGSGRDDEAHCRIAGGDFVIAERQFERGIGRRSPGLAGLQSNGEFDGL